MHVPAGDDLPLDPKERDALRAAIGVPRVEQALRAIEEVEKQVATEDLVILMVDSAAGAARAFFDVLVEVMSPRDAVAGPETREERR